MQYMTKEVNKRLIFSYSYSIRLVSVHLLNLIIISYQQLYKSSVKGFSQNNNN